jgi:hypothetical protein
VQLGAGSLDAGVAAELVGSVASVLPVAATVAPPLVVIVALPPSAELAGETACPPAECASPEPLTAGLLAAELDGAAELVQLAVGLADAEELVAAAELDPAALEPVAPDVAGVAEAGVAAILTGFFGGRAVSGGRTWVTSLITGATRSAIAEAPLR